MGRAYILLLLRKDAHIVNQYLDLILHCKIDVIATELENLHQALCNRQT